MSYTPLATYATASSTPLANVIGGWTTAEQTALFVRASRALESYAGRRLTPFTVTETQRAQNIDPDEFMPAFQPISNQASFGLSRSEALGTSDLVREFWLRQTPPLYPELWSGAITTISAYQTFIGTITIQPTTLHYEIDTGHVQLQLGTVVPMGGRLIVEYTGGYSTTPDDLVLACMWEATRQALISLEPEARPSLDLTEINQSIERLMAPYSLTDHPQV